MTFRFQKKKKKSLNFLLLHTSSEFLQVQAQSNKKKGKKIFTPSDIARYISLISGGVKILLQGLLSNNTKIVKNEGFSLPNNGTAKYIRAETNLSVHYCFSFSSPKTEIDSFM